MSEPSQGQIKLEKIKRRDNEMVDLTISDDSRKQFLAMRTERTQMVLNG